MVAKEDCFKLAVMQLRMEGKLNSKNYAKLFFDRAIAIRDYFIRQRRAEENARKRWEK